MTATTYIVITGITSLLIFIEMLEENNKNTSDEPKYIHDMEKYICIGGVSFLIGTVWPLTILFSIGTIIYKKEIPMSLKCILKLFKINKINKTEEKLKIAEKYMNQADYHKYLNEINNKF